MKLMLVKDDEVKPQDRQSIKTILNITGPGIYISDGHWGMSTGHEENARGIWGIFGGSYARVVVNMKRPCDFWHIEGSYDRGLINPRKIDLDLSELEAV